MLENLWTPREKHPKEFEDGDQYLVALRIKDGSKLYWEYSVITVRCDEDYFDCQCNGESWGWDWDCVEFYIKLSPNHLGMKI